MYCNCVIYAMWWGRSFFAHDSLAMKNEVGLVVGDKEFVVNVYRLFRTRELSLIAR